MKDRKHDEREIERGRDFFERIIHDAGEFGEENVDEIDQEWEEFEKVLRCVVKILRNPQFPDTLIKFSKLLF